MTRRFTMKMILPKTQQDAWQILTNIHAYPGLVKYVKKTKLLSKFELGGSWYDVTTILWVPLKIIHNISYLEPGQRVDYDIPLPLKGRILEKVHLSGQSLEVEVTLDLPKAVDIVLGPILEKRLKQMVLGTFKNIENNRWQD